MTMFIKIDLKDDVETDEAIAVARAIHDALDLADKIPDQITEMSVGGEHVTWISDEANDLAEAREAREEVSQQEGV